MTTTVNSAEPWGKIRAGLVGVNPTSVGLRYLRLTAAYIAHWFSRATSRWGMDQQALFGSYFYLAQLDAAPKTRFLGEEVMNTRDDLTLIFRPIVDASRWEKK